MADKIHIFEYFKMVLKIKKKYVGKLYKTENFSKQA
jgi:hypothetical protein